jgi:hypothetical protein
MKLTMQKVWDVTVDLSDVSEVLLTMLDSLAYGKYC